MSLSTVDLNSLIATRYMAAVAVTCSLWNHLINVDREIKFVWRPPWSFLQLLVMFNLYGGQASLIFIVYVLGDLRPPLHLSMCADQSLHMPRTNASAVGLIGARHTFYLFVYMGR
ncbi:hypothetical protein AcW1_007227 [Taiwanofungus camphoratus]|nr:hypothetical protein AcW1_007227 [Antrodia cinnamomea]